MKSIHWILGFFLLALFSCGQPQGEEGAQADKEKAFVWNPDNFADKKIIRYQIPGFEKLSLDQKKLVYYLTQAGLSGRDIMYDQNYRHNLIIRNAIDKIVSDYKGEKSGDEWEAFMVYAKNVWFSNGIHHHYSNDKFTPGFSKEYFTSLLEDVGATLPEKALPVIFDPSVDAKKVSQTGDDLVLSSAINFYDPDVTQKEVEAFYAGKKEAFAGKSFELGLNSKLTRKEDGTLAEATYKADGLYGPAIQQIISWLEKATTVAENDMQKKALEILIDYYKTGDPETWMKYNIAWVNATDGDIDYINSFIEVYNDPMGYKGSYESIVEIKDFDASARMEKVAANAQWFEDNSPIMDAHRKDSVVGISYKVVVVAGESGDASPATPIGVNLPNNNIVRARYGSKSVSLGNIIEAYSNAEGPGLLKEFAHDEKEMELAKAHGKLSSKIHTALHEVVGHASGQLEEGVGMPAETLKNYASPLEEARADLVGLYYLMDPKLVELGLMESLDVGKSAYDRYIKNGLMLQLRRIEPGKTIEQAHMRNRQMVASWAFEKSQEEDVISKVTRDGKIYFEINDYEKLRDIFGQLLREVQRIKSQGDYEAGKNLIENYGVQVDPVIHKEVLARSEKLNIPPYGGFINPKLVPVTDEAGAITDVIVEYPDNFVEQMLEYSKEYGFLRNGVK
jgi:dipeptidyl-peptidase-3